MEIKAGMVVWLKSGSPQMTVGDEMNGGNWRCSWFVGTELKVAIFNPNQLTDKDPKPIVKRANI